MLMIFWIYRGTREQYWFEARSFDVICWKHRLMMKKSTKLSLWKLSYIEKESLKTQQDLKTFEIENRGGERWDFFEILKYESKNATFLMQLDCNKFNIFERAYVRDTHVAVSIFIWQYSLRPYHTRAKNKANEFRTPTSVLQPDMNEIETGSIGEPLPNLAVSNTHLWLPLTTSSVKVTNK